MENKILFDGTIDIAIGRSRQETNWKNRPMLWSELVQKFSATHRTAETYNEYMAAKRARQDEIKDIGGFVGGYLSGGRRNKHSVMNRQLITLDKDFGGPGLWDDFIMLYGCAAVLYSTHKHSQEAPRLRLVIPLDRTVTPEEYKAISRHIAGVLGIDNFDPTTFEPERLMYWPSTSKDGEYIFEYQDGEWLKADEVLATYHNWRDTSEWPESSRENKQVQRAIKKQGDPLEKPGLVGAFCRTYSIEEAIDIFLSDVYDACTVPGRYTYKEGSTAGGLVTYDNKYAYSHHGTDPVSGKLCNAFDLVRLHKFGLQDEDAKEDTPPNKLPSYVSMLDFARKDTKVKKHLGAEQLHSAQGDFSESLEDEEADNEWKAELEVDRKGNYYSTINNIITILSNDPKLKGRLAFNTFEQREVVLKDLQWRTITPNSKYLTDKDDAGIRHYLEKEYSITGAQKIKDAMDMVLIKNSFHPVKDYLNSVKWDGENRVESVLIDYLGASDTEYTRTVTRKILAAAVTRIFRPGTKFDYVLVLVGKQGLKKSSLLDKLGKEWFSDSFATVQGKEAFEQIQGVWLVEMGELAGLKKAEVETIKHFISKREDRYRVAYGRRIENFPRQCVFFATTNNRDFLRDPTGNRRFWPVEVHETEPVKDVFQDLTDYDIDQIWAEAVELYKKGEPLYLSKEMEEEAFAMQVEHSEQDPRTGMIQEYLDKLLPIGWENMNTYQRRSFIQGDDLQEPGVIRRDKVCIAEIHCEALGYHQKDMNRYNTKDLHNIMRTMPGWEESKSTKSRFGIYGLQKGYIRVEKTNNPVTTKRKKKTVDAN